MRNNSLIGFVLAAVMSFAVAAQDSRSSGGLNVVVPAGAPVSVVNSGWGESRALARGGAVVLDLRTSIRLKNSGKARLKGISLQVSSQEVAAGGRASVSVPGLDVAPGDEFPVRIDLRLMQPASSATGTAAVTVTVDGVLFEDLSFYGPNRLSSRRQLTAWELESRRDRQYLRQILAKRGEEGLRRTMLDILSRDNARPKLDVRLARAAATNAGARTVQLAFLAQPDLPVQGVRATAFANGNELRIPEIVFENRGSREVRSIELGLLVRDEEGREFSAGALPASLPIKANGAATLQPSSALQLSRGPGAPVKVESVSSFVQQVEFANGEVWIPSGSFRDEARLTKLVPGSIEEQRLADIYRRRGFTALLEELQR
jgi:hypothetical protein